MDHTEKLSGRRMVRMIVAALLGLLFLAVFLPSTGGVISGPPRGGLPGPVMWRFGPFLFYPVPFFEVVGLVAAATGCTLFGLVRRSALEIVGWIIFGFLFFCLFM
jgi:hypothetical protein